MSEARTYRKSSIKICPTCSSPYKVYAYKEPIGEGKFCSLACRNASYIKHESLRFTDRKAYANIHNWVRKNKGRATICANCQTTESTKYDWANISHKYLKILNDYVSLCRKCHLRYDRGLITLKKGVE